MKPLRPAFVVTLSTLAAGAAACESTPPPQGPTIQENRNPPGQVTPLPKEGVLNPRDSEGRQVYVRDDGACYVTLPFDHPLTSWQPPKTKDVPCPPGASEPAFRECAFGTVVAPSATATDCECNVDGNPPPPPKKVKCPNR